MLRCLLGGGVEEDMLEFALQGRRRVGVGSRCASKIGFLSVLRAVRDGGLRNGDRGHDQQYENRNYGSLHKFLHLLQGYTEPAGRQRFLVSRFEPRMRYRRWLDVKPVLRSPFPVPGLPGA